MEQEYNNEELQKRHKDQEFWLGYNKDLTQDPDYIQKHIDKFPIPYSGVVKDLRPNKYPTFVERASNVSVNEGHPSKPKRSKHLNKNNRVKNVTGPAEINPALYPDVCTTPVADIAIVDPNKTIMPPTQQYVNTFYVDSVPQDPMYNKTATTVPTNLNISFSQGEKTTLFTKEDGDNRLGHVDAFRILNHAVILSNSGLLSSKIRITYYRDKEMLDIFSLVPGVRQDHHRLTLGAISNLTMAIYDLTKHTPKQHKVLTDELKRELNLLYGYVTRAIELSSKRINLLNDAAASVNIIDNLITVGVHSRCFNMSSLIETAKHLNLIAECLATFIMCVTYKSKKKKGAIDG